MSPRDRGHEGGYPQAEAALEGAPKFIGGDGGGRGAVRLGCEPAISIRRRGRDEAGGLAVKDGAATGWAGGSGVELAIEAVEASVEVNPPLGVHDGSERPRARGVGVAGAVEN